MKILILSDDFPPNVSGGAGVIAGNMAYGLSSAGNDVFVITTVQNKEKTGVFVENGLTIYRIYSNYDLRFRAFASLYNRKVFKEVEGITKKIKPDVVHAHNIHTYLSYAILATARKYSKAVFVTVHDVMSVHYGKLGASFVRGKVVVDKISPIKQFIQYKFRYNPFRNIVIKHYLKYIDKIFAVSNALRDVMVSEGIKGVEVLHNGIDLNKWVADENQIFKFKEKYNLENKKIIFFGGRLSSAKGGLIAIEVLKEVSKKIPDTVLLVAGEKNSSTKTMLDLAQELDIEGRVIFTGWVNHDDMKLVYAASDAVLVLSQYLDPFPTVNLEAMASKRPVIGTIFGGTKEVVLDGKTGFVVNPRDIQEITQRTIEILNNIEKSKVFGLAGYERVSKYFSLESWIKETLLWYAEILKNK